MLFDIWRYGRPALYFTAKIPQFFLTYSQKGIKFYAHPGKILKTTVYLESKIGTIPKEFAPSIKNLLPEQILSFKRSPYGKELNYLMLLPLWYMFLRMLLTCVMCVISPTHMIYTI